MVLFQAFSSRSMFFGWLANTLALWMSFSGVLLSPPQEQQDPQFTALHVVDPIPRAKFDLEFDNLRTNASSLGWISVGGPIQPVKGFGAPRMSLRSRSHFATSSA